MKYIGLLLLTMLVAFIPWIFLAIPWAAKDFNKVSLYLLVGSGLVLDWWWGTPLGLTALFLVGLTVVTKVLREKWPADQRMFSLIATLVSLVLMEAYLVLI